MGVVVANSMVGAGQVRYVDVAFPDRIVATMLVRPDLCTGGGILFGEPDFVGQSQVDNGADQYLVIGARQGVQNGHLDPT